ncbi:unnamed protein product [Clonostachys rosea]|uniref:Sterigmatocystin biosynthesis monooxygenase stcW n=1 Tax=Bionectria ochroleuca TaxID=29856 RepID=A0ABY6U3L8_BIOOC|nr:unnamed protein product [Clonostachys rosea]
MVFDSSALKHLGGESVPDDAPGGKYGYRIGHKKGDYEIPDIVLNSYHRKIKVITIGAGISGIHMSYLFQKFGENIEHVVYEKNGDIGGTWLENRYPGCACDVPSHAYAFAFALNPEWPRFLSPSEDIFRYLDRVVSCFELRKYMKFNSMVTSCEWNDQEGEWHVKIQDSVTGKIHEDISDIVIGAYGLLNSWKLPADVEGLDTFQGRLIHTARWPVDYNQEQWKGQRVAVIGSGATSLQVVPTMQPHVKQMDVFVRTPVWFAEIAGHGGDNFEYSDEERDLLKRDPKTLVDKAKGIENTLNGTGGFKSLLRHSQESRWAQQFFTDKMRKIIKRDDIFEKLLPNFAVGCRRLTPGDAYMKAVQEPNVNVHRCAVTKVGPKTIIGSNGEEADVDTIICATGFDVSFRPRFSVIGRNGTTLQAKWRHVPEGYLSLAIPDIPNYFTIMGPSFPIANGSVMGPLQMVAKYILKVVQKMQRDHIKSLSPKQSVTNEFNEHVQTWIDGAAWADPKCRSWYKDNKTGRVNAIWPGSSLQFNELIKEPRYEDFEIQYQNKHNRWEFLGLGFTKEMLEDGSDMSPYIGIDEIDERFTHYVPDRKAEDERYSKLPQMARDGPSLSGTV